MPAALPAPRYHSRRRHVWSVIACANRYSRVVAAILFALCQNAPTASMPAINPPVVISTVTDEVLARGPDGEIDVIYGVPSACCLAASLLTSLNRTIERRA